MASALANSNVRPHDRFFFSDDSLYLLVEDSLYCVHKSLFESHASLFPVRELETSRNKPYVLGDVKKIDFDRLLANLYPRTLGVEEAETTQDWISVLALASKWGFNSLRSKAILKIEQTLDSPIDMVTLGRRYGIPDVLLPGYAVLCQSTVPLSYEEGLRLGMEDVVTIYRIRHELYGSGITPVPLEVAFAKVKEAGLGDERPRQEELEGEQASTWTDIGSVATSQKSAENEEERESAPLGNGGSDDPSSVPPGNVSDLNSESSENARECLNLAKELTEKNFDLVSVEIMQWVKTKDVHTLHQVSRLIVEKAIAVPNDSRYEHNPYPRLCKIMVNYTQPLHQMIRVIVEKAMEDRFHACALLCNTMMKDINGNTIAGGSLFSAYLGIICQENLEAIAASLTGAGAGEHCEHMARVRRMRLIMFIKTLAECAKAVDMWAPAIVNKWSLE